LRFKEIISEITANHPVGQMWPGQYGLPMDKRVQQGQQMIGEWNSKYNIWVTSHNPGADTELEVTTKPIPHPFIGEFRKQFGQSSDLPDGYEDLPQEEFDRLLQRKYDGPREYRVMTLTLIEEVMETDDNKVYGKRVSWVQKTPEGVGSEINMVEFYIWLMNTFNTAIISDYTQSKGGTSIWNKLAKDPRVDMFAYKEGGIWNKGKFSQVDAEGDADAWDTWTRDDQDIVDQARATRKKAWGTTNIHDAIWNARVEYEEGNMSEEEFKAKEKEIIDLENRLRQESEEARNDIEYTRHNLLFIVPSNRSMHS